MRKYGKKYQAALKLIDTNKVYSVAEACELVKTTGITKFEGTVGLSIRLNINTKQADQQIRGTVVLPNGTLLQKLKTLKPLVQIMPVEKNYLKRFLVDGSISMLFAPLQK